MRIETSSISRISRTDPAPRTQKAAPADLRSPQDSLSLSSTGLLFMSAQKALRALPQVRVTKVQEFSSLFAGGQYRANPEAVAKSMVENTNY